MTKAELNAALRAATGPSRELDWEIFGTVAKRGTQWHQFCGLQPRDVSDEAKWKAYLIRYSPLYTSSIDAALTLVPDRYLWELKSGFTATATVWHVMIDYDDQDQHPVPFGSSHFPAIALCIAALEATP